MSAPNPPADSSAVTAAPAAPPVLDLCCGGRKCPTFQAKDRGISITDPTVLGDKSLDLDEEQTRALAEWLRRRGF